jgi:hypothetical protein
VLVDSQNPDVITRLPPTILNRSLTAAKTFTAFKGAPGGEDPHGVARSDGQQAHLLRLRSGPADHARRRPTWSGYYQIPIAQLYHLSTDNQYPYWVMGSQQDTARS